MGGDSVTLTGIWASPYVPRTKSTLELKGVQYQYVEEDFSNKSAMLLHYKPVYKKVPVLMHGRKALAKSVGILKYNDETWKHNPLLPNDPYEKTKATSWFSFVDEKGYGARVTKTEGDSVKLIGFWASPYVLRVKAALELKGVQYQYVEEDISTKSTMLLQYNPVYKKVPVLVHDGKVLAESLVILEYIDEIWKHNPLLPNDPYEKAKARFWSRFVDEKCMPALSATFSKGGEEQKKAAQEFRENLKRLESGLEGKRYFGGEKIGFTDIAVGWLGGWLRIVEEIVGINLIDTDSMAKLNAWFDDFFDLPIIIECMPPRDKLVQPIIIECMPPRDKLVQHIKTLHKAVTSSST